MKKTAVFELRLHDGKAPPWLISRMRKLARPIFEIIILEYGQKELLKRLADPLWFQALSYVLGYDWDSSGVTTVTTGVLREVLSPDLGIMMAGGKGKRSLEAPNDIIKIGEEFGFSESKINELVRASRLVAKVDNAVLQDEHQIYHHAFFVDKDGDWTVIQQGMCPRLKTARRYHWTSLNLKSFVIDPHEIIGEIKLPFALNMASKESIEAQKVSVDLVKEGVSRIKRDYSNLLRMARRETILDAFLEGKKIEIKPTPEVIVKILPVRVNWNALKKAYEIQPKTYEELVEIRGIGPGTIRALALVAELIYEAEVSWKDPLRYTFAHGGKDRIPYPVNVKRMEKVAEFLEDVIEEIKLGKKEKQEMLKRLSKLVSRVYK